jgi:zinc transport system ATP-binding protein
VTAAIEIRDLSVTLLRQAVLRGVNLDVTRGQCHAVVGPNGAGKTTLLRTILGELPHRGTIRLRYAGAGRIGYVPQRLEVATGVPVTVADFLQLNLDRRPVFFGSGRTLRARLHELLDQVGCAHLMARQLRELSGGELRRVLVAQALAPQPEFLLLDEPASNVDQAGRAGLVELLDGIRRAHGITMLLVEHDDDFVERLAQMVTVLNRQVVFTGDVSGWRAHGGHAGTSAEGRPLELLRRQAIA